MEYENFVEQIYSNMQGAGYTIFHDFLKQESTKKAYEEYKKKVNYVPKKKTTKKVVDEEPKESVTDTKKYKQQTKRIIKTLMTHNEFLKSLYNDMFKFVNRDKKIKKYHILNFLGREDSMRDEARRLYNQTIDKVERMSNYADKYSIDEEKEIKQLADANYDIYEKYIKMYKANYD